MSMALDSASSLSLESSFGVPEQWRGRAQTTSPRPAAATDKARIVLVVEDNLATQRLFRHYLTEAGYATDAISDGIHLVEVVKQISPAVICLDIRLPGVSDWEALRRLKEDPETSAIPIVVVTVLEDDHTAFALGAASFLTKPIARADLLSAVANAMRSTP